MRRSVYRQKKRYRATASGKGMYKVKQKMPTHALCGLCHKKLSGVPKRPSGSKTQNRPERKFGGNLCHACTQRVVTARTRLAHNVMSEEDVPLTILKYVRMSR